MNGMNIGATMIANDVSLLAAQSSGMKKERAII